MPPHEKDDHPDHARPDAPTLPSGPPIFSDRRQRHPSPPPLGTPPETPDATNPPPEDPPKS